MPEKNRRVSQHVPSALVEPLQVSSVSLLLRFVMKIMAQSLLKHLFGHMFVLALQTTCCASSSLQVAKLSQR